MLGPLFFFITGIFITIMAHKKKALWLTRGGICFVILGPVSFFMDRSPAMSGNVALGVVVMAAAIFCVVVGMAKREQFLLKNVDH